jgi:hypothetical protein
VLVAGLALMVTMSWRAAGHLPSTVTLTGTGRGGRDQHLPRLLLLTLMPALTLLIGVAGLSMQRIRRRVAARLNLPLWRDDVTHRRAMDTGLGVLVPVFLALHLVWLRAAEHVPWTGLGFVAASVAVVLIGIGNAWPKRAPSLPQAIREQLTVPGARLADAVIEGERRALWPTGVAMVVAGLVALALAWPTPQGSLGVSLVAGAGFGLVPVAVAWRSLTAPGPANPRP